MRIDWKTFRKKLTIDKSKQFPVGSRVYHGYQGSGKTLSMVKYAFDVQEQFPDCHIYSNLVIKGLDNYHLLENDEDLARALESRHEGGALILLDEAHLFFHKSNGIPLDVLTAISQQRKDRKRLVFSSQIWEELDISLRKQVKEIVKCKCIGKRIQLNVISDGESLRYDKMQSAYVSDKLYTFIFKHNNELYSAYDTRQKVIRNREYKRDYKIEPTTFAVKLKA